MDDEKIQKILQQYKSGELDIGEAAIELLSAGVPAGEIIEMLRKEKEES